MVLTFKDNKDVSVQIKISVKKVMDTDYNLYQDLTNHFLTEYNRDYKEFHLIKVLIMDL